MKFPENLSDIKLKQYQLFDNIEEPTNEDLVKCLLDINDKQLNKFTVKEVNTLTQHFNDLINSENNPFVPTFKLNGVEYGFIPNLDDITYGENKDLTSYINDFRTMNKAMAVAYRPIKQKQGNKYIIQDYEGSHVYAEVMKDAPLDVVFGMMVFFYDLTKELLQVTQNYLKEELVKEMTLVENGEDIARYTHLLRVISEDLTKLQDYPYILV